VRFSRARGKLFSAILMIPDGSDSLPGETVAATAAAPLFKSWATLAEFSKFSSRTCGLAVTRREQIASD